MNSYAAITAPVALTPPPQGGPTAREPQAPGAQAADLATADDEALARLLGVLSLASRLRILFLLGREEWSVGRLWSELALPQATVSHQLCLLRQCGLVHCRREGKRVYYGLSGRVTVGDDGALHVATRGLSVRISARGGGMTTVTPATPAWSPEQNP